MKQSFTRYLSMAVIAFFALCCLSCPNPWLTRMFKKDTSPAYTYAAPALGSAVNGVSVASITFDKPSPQAAGTSVTATVNFSGTATTPAIFVINLTSTKAGLNGAARTQIMALGGTPAVETFTFTVPAQNIDDFVLSFAAPVHNVSLKVTFGITTAGTTGVTDTFNAVHAYVSGRTAAQLASDSIIEPGDYIDLEGGITVSGITVPDKQLSIHGNLLRLIVVGINSFKAASPYAGGGTGGETAHLVFQFQNIPFTRGMEATDTNANGYAGSAIRPYLTGAFLTGLIAAGVPESVLWAPKRYVANKGLGANAADLIEDKLWLPTVREMFGTNESYAHDTYETAINQARLEYYTSGTLLKYDTNNYTISWYWLSSPSSTNNQSFCGVSYLSTAGPANAADPGGGIAPAFCVK